MLAVFLASVCELTVPVVQYMFPTNHLDHASPVPLAIRTDHEARDVCVDPPFQDEAYCPAKARIMIVDDEQINIELLKLYLRQAGFENFWATAEPLQVMDLINESRPDVILLDVMMPDVDGFQILFGLREDPRLRHIPVIILTASDSPEWKLRALELGVNDFLCKPVDPSELLLRMRNALTAKSLRDELASYSARLEEQVKQRTVELEMARQEAMHCLARAAEYRDDDTGRHVIRVGLYAAIIARRLGFDPDQVDVLEQAAQLHDVGKIGIPDSVLLKPGKLEPEEFEVMKKHCAFGKRIIQPMSDDDWAADRNPEACSSSHARIASSPIMQLAALIAETHHEWWNGTGYPNGLKGDEIPIEGRITAVADVFDALCTNRPYKTAFPNTECFAVLRRGPWHSI